MASINSNNNNSNNNNGNNSNNRERTHTGGSTGKGERKGNVCASEAARMWSPRSTGFVSIGSIAGGGGGAADSSNSAARYSYSNFNRTK
jgi:hypothetical protein